MRLIVALALALVLLSAGWAWQAGAFQALGHWVLMQQRWMQDALAARIGGLRAGEPGAFWALVGMCGLYGFAHAVGPGHGKALIGGAAVGGRATAARMMAVAVAGSLAQAAVAILLVYGGFAIFEATARATVGTVETWAAPAGHAALAAIGVWILVRGVRAWPRGGAHDHDHDHDHGPGCGCGHAHAPDAGAVADAKGLGATLALVGAMAARPCTGALFVLAIAWQMGVARAGAAAVVAMGLGAAAFTAIVAVLAVSGREAALFSAGGGRVGRAAVPALQVGAGLMLATAGGLLLVA